LPLPESDLLHLWRETQQKITERRACRAIKQHGGITEADDGLHAKAKMKIAKSCAYHAECTWPWW
jgi:hypothetical protein